MMQIYYCDRFACFFLLMQDILLWCMTCCPSLMGFYRRVKFSSTDVMIVYCIWGVCAYICEIFEDSWFFCSRKHVHMCTCAHEWWVTCAFQNLELIVWLTRVGEWKQKLATTWKVRPYTLQSSPSPPSTSKMCISCGIPWLYSMAHIYKRIIFNNVMIIVELRPAQNCGGIWKPKSDMQPYSLAYILGGGINKTKNWTQKKVEILS
jgi:hypothetical protein